MAKAEIKFGELGGGGEIDVCEFGSFGSSNSGTLTFTNAMDKVFLLAQGGLHNTAPAVCNYSLKKGESDTFSPNEICTVSLSADGLTLTYSKNKVANYWAVIGVKYS